MTYAYSISIFCSILLAWLLNFKKNPYITKNFLITVFLINVVGLYLTYTRGALLGFLISIPFIFLPKNKKLFKWSLVVGLFIAIIGAVFVVKNPDSNFLRIKRTQSIKHRVSLYYAASYMIKENSVLGIGYRNFSSLVAKYKEKYDLNKISNFKGHAHSNYFEILSGMGLIGFLCYMGFFVAWMKHCLQSGHPYGIVIFPGIINFMASGLFQSTFIDGEITFLIMCLFSLTLIMDQKRKESPEVKEAIA